VPCAPVCLRALHPIAKASLHRAASDVSVDVDADAVAERVEVDAEPLAGRDWPREQARIGAGCSPEADPAAEQLPAANLDLAVKRVTGTHAGR